MEHTYRKRAEAFLKRHGKKRIWHGALTAMAAVVVFITSYMLILPAITLSQEPVCGLETHTHTAQCNPLYDEETGGWIYSCGLEAHVHTDACYPQAEPEPVYYCGLDEHVHGADCYKLDTLICMQTEHIHGAECLQPRTAEPVETGNVEMAEAGDSPIQLGVRLIEMDDAKIRQMLEEWLNEQKSRQEDEVPGNQPESYPVYSSSASAGDVSDNDVSGNDVSGGDVSGNNAAPTGGSPYAGAPAAALREVSGGDVTWGDVAGGDVPEYDAEIFDEEELFRESRLMGLDLERSEDATPLTHQNYELEVSNAVFESAKDFYEAGMHFTFHITPTQAKEDGLHYKLTLPKGMYPTEALLQKQEEEGGFFKAKDKADDIGFYAQFKMDEEGQWYIDINWVESYVQEALGMADDMECYLDFYCKLDKSGYDKESGKLHYFTEDLTVEWEPGQITYPEENKTALYDIYVAKSGSYDSTNNVLTYTVTVSSQKGTSKEVSLSDILDPKTLTLLEEQNGSVKVEKTVVNEWNNPYGDRTLVESDMHLSADGKLSGTLPQLGEREAYVVTYSYQLSDLPAGFDREIVDNSVTVQSDNGVPGGKVKDDSKTSVTVEKKDLGKSGQYKEESNEIEWTIRVNESGKNIANKTLSDPRFAEMVEGSFVITPSDGWHWEPAEKGEIQFDGIEDGVNTRCYEIKFKTQVDPSKLQWGNNIIENTAEFDGNKASAQVTVTVGEVEKEASDVTTPEGDSSKSVIQWTVSIKVPQGGFPASGEGQDAVTVTDRLDVTANGNESSRLDYYMTWNQVEALKIALANTQWFIDGVGNAEKMLRVKYYNWELNDPNNEWYYTWKEKESTYEELAGKSLEELASMQFIGFSFDFVNGLEGGAEEQTLVITYESTAETAGITKDKTFKNKVDVEGKEKWASYEFRKNVVKTDGNGSETDNQKTLECGEDDKYRLSWRVRVIVQEGQTYLEVLDTLPDGIELEKLTLTTADNKKAELTWNETGVITEEPETLLGSFDLSGSKYMGQDVLLVLQLKENADRPDWFKAGKELWINYDCILTDTETKNVLELLNKTQEAQVKEYGNSVSVKFSKDQEVPEKDSQKQKVTFNPQEEEILDKFGNYRANGKLGVWDNNNRRLKFHVDINPEGKDLLEGADTLTLTDELHLMRANANIVFSVMLMPSNVKLWYAQVDENGQPVRDEFGKLKASDREVPMGQGEGRWSWTYRVDDTTENWATGYNYYIIKAVIPDGVALVFEYEYIVSAEDTNEKGGEDNDIFTSDNAAHLKLFGNNSATLEGVTRNPTQEGIDEKYERAEFSAGVSLKGSYTFYKVDSKDYGTALEGAKFRLYKYDGSSSSWIKTDKQYVTEGPNGSFVIKDKKKDGDTDSSDFDFEPDTMYYVIEEEAPVGYEIPEPNIPYYFYFSSEDETSGAKPDGWESLGAVDLTLQPQVVYCANEKLPELEVEKEWLSLDGAKINQSTGKVKFELYRRTVSSEAVEGPSTGGSSEGTSVGVLKNSSAMPSNVEGKPRFVFQENTRKDSYQYCEFDESLVGSRITVKMKYKYNEYVDWGLNKELQFEKYSDDEKLEHSDNSGSDGYYVFSFTLCQNTNILVISQENNSDWDILSVTAVRPPDPGESPTEPDVRPGDVLIGTYDITPEKDSEGNWLWKWKSGDVENLTLLRSEVIDNVRYQYAYYVKEISVYADSGSEGENLIGSYTVNYSENNTDGLANGGTIKITNTSKEAYSLPMTGGTGTRLYTLGGLFATALAGLLLYRKSRGKEERFSS